MNKVTVVPLYMEHIFTADPERIFDAWITPATMKKWLFTDEKTNKITKNEARSGGGWEIVDHREGQTYRAIGQYKVVDRPSRLVMTFKMPQFSDLEDTITVQLEPHDDGGTHMSFKQDIHVEHEDGWTQEDIDRVTREHLDGTKQGFEQMFANLEIVLEKGSLY
ncbi:SRPBCC domain-containing protein [Paenalkalicoccus suaedae]|uniref:SRPBCC domain-containing protein n=1 Tax=Paenalkalicoccus suaedae TaxID=2592382 RepID=A0A859FAX7_9BACI|nr:SRPBCC domain-containing protein [Paenalkalicoccus suaedae]QKS69932.1 SRPBCC domain-containing protein [Paenalkalicoccus suaedae]